MQLDYEANNCLLYFYLYIILIQSFCKVIFVHSKLHFSDQNKICTIQLAQLTCTFDQSGIWLDYVRNNKTPIRVLFQKNFFISGTEIFCQKATESSWVRALKEPLMW